MDGSGAAGSVLNVGTAPYVRFEGTVQKVGVRQDELIWPCRNLDAKSADLGIIIFQYLVNGFAGILLIYMEIQLF